VLGLSGCFGRQTQPQIITYVPVATAQAMGLPSGFTASSINQPELHTIAAPSLYNQTLAAQVNGQPILLEAYEKQVNRFEQALAGQDFDSDSPNGQARLVEIRRQSLEMLIDQVIIQQEAQRLQVVITKEELQARTNETMAGRGSDQFKQWLIINNLTQTEFAEMLRFELMANRVFEQLTQNIGDNTAKQQFFQEWLAKQKSSAHIERYVAL
jgi:hypothetical protein